MISDVLTAVIVSLMALLIIYPATRAIIYPAGKSIWRTWQARQKQGPDGEA
jgi:hypothetical protein